jgi:putative transposase
VKYRFIDQHKDKHASTLLCQVLGVSPQAYYNWRKREPSLRQRSNEIRSSETLLERIRSVHQSSRRTYGSPRVLRELHALGVSCSRKRVARLMGLHDIRAITVRRFRVTTDSAHSLPVAPNLLDRQFTVTTPNRAWVTDITYIPTREGWLYLCVYLDLFSRCIVGWAMSERMTTELVTSALSMAVQQRRPEAGLLVHSDRGSQYASEFYQRCLAAGQFVCRPIRLQYES